MTTGYVVDVPDADGEPMYTTLPAIDCSDPSGTTVALSPTLTGAMSLTPTLVETSKPFAPAITTLAVDEPAVTCWPACNDKPTTVPMIGLLIVACATASSAAVTC